MSEIVLAFAGTAVRKRAIREKLEAQDGIIVRDVDKILCGAPETRARLVSAGAYAFRDPAIAPRLIDVIQRLPRTDVLELWNSSLSAAAAALGTSDDAVRVLMTGIMYHSNRRSEFYSPFDLTVLTRELSEHSLSVGRVIMFIDDLYDLYARLSGVGEIYERASSVKAEYGRITAEDSVVPAALSEAEQVLIATEVQVSELITLLHWRQLEVTQAERMAQSLQVQYLLWATKNNLTALLPWLRGEALAVLYVSHPISRPRRILAEEGRWPPFVEECNALPAQFAALNTTAVMPTAIDEFRLKKEAAAKDLRPRRRPYLGERWPLVPGELLYTSDSAGAPNHHDLLAPHILRESDLLPAPADKDTNDPLHDALRSLERQIGGQVAARDHTLVVHTHHIVVFRPFYGDPSISGGVRAEIDHWSTLARKDTRRRVVFAHRLSDVSAAFDKNFAIEDVDTRLRNASEELVEELLGVTRAEARRIMRTASSGWDLLDRGARTAGEIAKEEAVIKRAVREAPRRAVWRILAQFKLEILGVAEAQVGLWVISDESPWEPIWPAVLEFLSGGEIREEAYAPAVALLNSMKANRKKAG